MKQSLRWILLLFAGSFVLGYLIAATGSSERLFITDTFYLIPRKQPWVFALLFALVMLLLRIVLLITVSVCFRVLASRYAMVIFGTFIFLFGAGGLFLVLTHLPEEGAKKVYHVIAVALFFSLLGLLMMWVGRHGRRTRRSKGNKQDSF